MLTSAILQAINGVSLAALLFLLASGFTLSFGLMRVVNMAHGAYYLLGGYIGLSIAQKTGSFAFALAGGGARGGGGGPRAGERHRHQRRSPVRHGVGAGVVSRRHGGRGGRRLPHALSGRRMG